MSAALVTIDCTDGVADVRFNRADKHNSLTLEMFALRALWNEEYLLLDTGTVPREAQIS